MRRRRKTRRPRGVGSIDTLPSGRVRARITIGTSLRSGTFDERSDAERWLAQQQTTSSVRGTREDATLRELRDTYLQDMRTRGHTEATIKGARSHLDRVLESWGDLRLRDIDGPCLKRIVSDMSARGWSASTVRNRIDRITSMFKTAVEWGYVEDRPLSVRRPRLLLSSRPDPYSSPEMVALLETATAQDDPRYRAAVTLAAYAGLRASEILRLRHDDLRPHHLVVPVRSATDRPKSGRERIVPVPAVVRESVMACPARGGERVVDQGWRHVSGMHHWLETVWAEAGIDGVRLHRLRHFWCCAMASCGALPFELQTWGGWATVGAMSRYYHHPIALAAEVKRTFETMLGRAREARFSPAIMSRSVTLVG